LRIILARTAGFCMGVKRAMEKVLAVAREKQGPIFTSGPLIHNRQVVEMLEARGICARTDFEGVDKGTVLLRAHGVPPDIVAALRAAGLEVVDGTCPHVVKGQRSIARQSAAGYHIVIVGDRDHDEVLGLVGHAAGPIRIIASVEEAAAVPLEGKVLVVAQTTFNESLFRDIVETLRSRKPDVEIVDSICSATSERQEEARELAEKVDAMVVVGGFHSANTRRLAEVARSTGTPTVHVETADELDLDELAAYESIGVTAGASTPSWITNTVLERLRGIGRARSPLGRLWALLAGVVIDGNLFVAAGAAALTYAVTKLLRLDIDGIVDRVCLMLAAFGYIFSAYVLGRRGENEAGDGGPTRRGEFYRSHRNWMTVVSALLSIVAVAAVVRFHWLAAGLLGLSYATAVLYGLMVSPDERSLVAVLRNVPASKDILAAAGWTVVTVLLPVVAAGGAGVGAVAVVAAVVFGMAFIRSVMFDFSDVTADRLLGRDTFPALVGVGRARTILAALAVVLAVVLAAGVAAGLIAGPRYWILLFPAYVLLYLLAFARQITGSERRCALVVDGGFFLAAVICFVYAVSMAR